MRCGDNSEKFTKSVEKGKLSEDVRDSILTRIVATTSFSALGDVDYVVEVATERGT